jgi:hypothetical protein
MISTAAGSPYVSQHVHFPLNRAGVGGSILVSLLIMPAAYHRILYDESDVADFYRVVSRFPLGASRAVPLIA